MSWDYKRYGSADQPVHKSDLNSITGDYGCLAAFKRKQEERADGDNTSTRDSVAGKALAGTATHETITRTLDNEGVRGHLMGPAGTMRFDATGVTKVYDEEYDREANGRNIVWYNPKDNPTKINSERVDMVVGLMNDLRNHVHEILLAEACFIVRLGDYWMSGFQDLIYRPRWAPDKLASADWKTGATKTSQIELDHGWEAGIYASAMHSGLFLPRSAMEVTRVQIDGIWFWRATIGRVHNRLNQSRWLAERICMEDAMILVAKWADNLPGWDILGLVPRTCSPEEIALADILKACVAFNEFPIDVRNVHLPDYVPYQKGGKKQISRPEDLAFFNLNLGGAKSIELKYERGMLRGPAWYKVERTEHDIPRLEAQVRSIVGTVRMGRFFESRGEKCARCSFAGPCLTSGYEMRGDELKSARSLMRDMDDDVNDGL